jgi:hypothetical protein
MTETADPAALDPIAVEPFVLRSVRESWDVFKADPVLYIAGAVIAAVVSVLSIGILAGPMADGFIQLVRRRRRGELVQLGDLRQGLALFASSFIALLLVAVAASIGFLLLVIPGLLVLIVTCFALHEIAYRGLSAVDALRASFQLARHRSLHVLVVLVGVAALNALGGVVLFGTLLTAPYAIVWTTVAYEILTGQTPERPTIRGALDPV